MTKEKTLTSLFLLFLPICLLGKLITKFLLLEMKALIFLFFFLLLFIVVWSLSLPPNFFRPRFLLPALSPKFNGRDYRPSDIPPFQEKWFTQTLDHFNFFTTPETFQQRYLMTGLKIQHNLFIFYFLCEYDDIISLLVCLDRYYKPGGPLFFYCGNEGDIEMFWNNTGFQFELAQQFS